MPHYYHVTFLARMTQSDTAFIPGRIVTRSDKLIENDRQLISLENHILKLTGASRVVVQDWKEIKSWRQDVLFRKFDWWKKWKYPEYFPTCIHCGTPMRRDNMLCQLCATK